MPYAVEIFPCGGKRVRRQCITAPRNICRGAKSSSPGIIDANRKTEICRNWQTGTCPYGEKCAFAHGIHELKIQTLNEMERAGRIPNAAKFRSYPCMTWVATGSCPYQSRCVFLHDPRLRAHNSGVLPDLSGDFLRQSSPSIDSENRSFETSESLFSTPNFENRKFFNDENSHGMNVPPMLGMSGLSENKDFFFWPHVQRDLEGQFVVDDGVPSELPPCEATYELSSDMAEAIKIGDASASAVYHLWYSLVESVLSDKGLSTDTAANGMPPIPPVHLPIFQELANGKELTPNDVPMPKLSTCEPGEVPRLDCAHCLSGRDHSHHLSMTNIQPRSYSRNSENSFLASPRIASSPATNDILKPVVLKNVPPQQTVFVPIPQSNIVRGNPSFLYHMAPLCSEMDGRKLILNGSSFSTPESLSPYATAFKENVGCFRNTYNSDTRHVLGPFR